MSQPVNWLNTAKPLDLGIISLTPNDTLCWNSFESACTDFELHAAGQVLRVNGRQPAAIRLKLSGSDHV